VKHLLFNGVGDLEWRETAAPVIQDERDALVRPIAVARCDLDTAIATGLYPMKPPFTMGHEMVGEIVEAGGRAGAWEAGDRVIVPFQISCGECSRCLRGLTNACESVPLGASFGLAVRDGMDFGGALSDLVRVPWAEHMLLPLPDSIPPEVAAGIPDNVSDGYRTVAGPLAEYPGAPVLVVGGPAQSVGLYAVASAVALGSERVVYVDFDEHRAAIARDFGAEAVAMSFEELAEFSWQERFPITVDACTLPPGRDLAIQSTSPCGHCTSVSGGPLGKVEIPIARMYAKGITWDVSRVHARATAPEVIDLVTEGRLDPGSLITRTVPFEDAAEAMVEDAVKIVFTR
jgi:alcohol dehydrogenase